MLIDGDLIRRDSAIEYNTMFRFSNIYIVI